MNKVDMIKDSGHNKLLDCYIIWENHVLLQAI